MTRQRRAASLRCIATAADAYAAATTTGSTSTRILLLDLSPHQRFVRISVNRSWRFMKHTATHGSPHHLLVRVELLVRTSLLQVHLLLLRLGELDLRPSTPHHWIGLLLLLLTLKLLLLELLLLKLLLLRQLLRLLLHLSGPHGILLRKLLLLLNIHLMRIEILNRQLLLLLTRMHLLLLSSNVHSTVVNSSADDWSSHGHWRAIPREPVR